MKRPLALATMGAALAACAREPRAPSIPPFHGDPAIAPSAPIASSSTSPLPVPSADPAPPAPAELKVFFAIEPPFRLDQRIFPKDKPTFLADLRERTRWNTGSMGALASDPPPVPGHPPPKVIVDVTRASGGHAAADVQRVLRKMFWIKAIECYGLGAYKDQKLRGKATFGLRIARAGKITAATLEGSTFDDADVTTCMADRLKAIDLPAAKAGSQAMMDVQVGPGDEPVPPPPDLITPGEGTLAPDAIRAVIDAAHPTFEACYRPALDYAPELWGRLGIRFHVTEKGKLDEAFEVETRFPDERVTLCVLRAARGLKFPKPANGELRFIVPIRLWSSRSPVDPPNIPGVKF